MSYRQATASDRLEWIQTEKKGLMKLDALLAEKAELKRQSRKDRQFHRNTTPHTSACTA